MEEIEKFVLSMEEKVSELDAQMQEQVKALNAKMDAIKALIAEKKTDIANAKNGIEGRIFKVGDVILSDGTVIKADDVEDMDETDIEKAEGIVCFTKKEGKTAYIINAKTPAIYNVDLFMYNELEGYVMDGPISGHYEDNKPAIEKYEKQFGKNLSKFNDGWKLTTSRILLNIAENLEIINKNLAVLGIKKINKECFFFIKDRDENDWHWMNLKGNKQGCSSEDNTIIAVHEV